VKTARWLVIVGCLLSFGTAMLHGAGFRAVSAEIAGTNARPVLVAAYKVLWLAFSVEFIVLSAIAAAALGSSRAKQLILLCSLIPIFNAGLMLFFLGPFLGVYCVAATAVFFLTGGFLLPDAAQPASMP